MAYWGRSVRYTKRPADIIRPGDGINTYESPFQIKKSEFVSANNISNRILGALSVRPGSTSMYGSAAAPITAINGAGVRSGTIPHLADGTTWKYWNAGTSAYINVATGLANAKAKIFEFPTQANRYTIFVNGTDKKYWNGAGAAGDIADGPATALYTVDDFRLYALLGSTLYYSAAGSVTDWTTAGDAGDLDLTGMQGTGLALTTYNDMVLAWSDQTMHVVYGNNDSDLEPSDPIPVGNVSDRSIVIHDNICYWMDYNRLMGFTGGVPFEVGGLARGYFDLINYTYKQNVVAGKWGRYIYLSFPYNGSTTNNQTLEYDTTNGVKKWYPWDVGFVNFFNMGEDLYGITAGGVIKKLQQGTADDSTVITWSATTGVWESEPLMATKVISDFYVDVYLPVGSTLTLSYSTTIDSNDFTTLYTFTASASKQRVRVMVPTTALQDIDYYRLKWAGTGPCDIYAIEPDERIKPM